MVMKIHSWNAKMRKCICAHMILMLLSFATVSVLSSIRLLPITTVCHAAASECEMNNAGCDHYCTETLYSYTCSCYPGYTLQQDGHTCIG